MAKELLVRKQLCSVFGKSDEPAWGMREDDVHGHLISSGAVWAFAAFHLPLSFSRPEGDDVRIPALGSGLIKWLGKEHVMGVDNFTSAGCSLSSSDEWTSLELKGNFLNHAPSKVLGTKKQPPWIVLDLGPLLSISVSSYALRMQRTMAPTSWQLQGQAEDGTSWQVLADERQQIPTASSDIYVIRHRYLTTSSPPMKKLRIVVTGPTAKEWCLQRSGLEVYGTLVASKPTNKSFGGVEFLQNAVGDLKAFPFGRDPSRQLRPQSIVHAEQTKGVLSFLGRTKVEDVDDELWHWVNPCESGVVGTSSSALPENMAFETLHSLAREEQSEVVTTVCTADSPGSWISFHFGECCQIFPTAYMLAQAPGGALRLRQWEFQASCDGAEWEVLERHDEDFPTSQTWTLNVDRKFSWFRVLQWGQNSSGTNVLQLGAFELFGIIVSNTQTTSSLTVPEQDEGLSPAAQVLSARMANAPDEPESEEKIFDDDLRLLVAGIVAPLEDEHGIALEPKVRNAQAVNKDATVVEVDGLMAEIEELRKENNQLRKRQQWVQEREKYLQQQTQSRKELVKGQSDHVFGAGDAYWDASAAHKGVHQPQPGAVQPLDSPRRRRPTMMSVEIQAQYLADQRRADLEARTKKNKYSGQELAGLCV